MIKMITIIIVNHYTLGDAMRTSESNLVNDISGLCRANIMHNADNVGSLDGVIRELHVKYNLRRSVFCNIKSTNTLVNSVMEAILTRHATYRRHPAGKRKYNLDVDIKTSKYYGIRITVHPKKLNITISAGTEQTYVEYPLPLTPYNYDKVMLTILPEGMRASLLSERTDSTTWVKDYLATLA